MAFCLNGHRLPEHARKLGLLLLALLPKRLRKWATKSPPGGSCNRRMSRLYPAPMSWATKTKSSQRRSKLVFRSCLKPRPVVVAKACGWLVRTTKLYQRYAACVPKPSHRSAMTVCTWKSLSRNRAMLRSKSWLTPLAIRSICTNASARCNVATKRSLRNRPPWPLTKASVSKWAKSRLMPLKPSITWAQEQSSS